jgi:hypothetical protein
MWVECLDSATHAQGMVMDSVTVGLLGFLNAFATAVALKDIQYNFVFIFVACGDTEWYFFRVELLAVA